MNSHELKTWPSQFQAVLDGKKRHEWRKNDRDFQVSDELILCEYQPWDGLYTGRKIHCLVTWLTEGFGVPAGWCCMTIRPETERG